MNNSPINQERYYQTPNEKLEYTLGKSNQHMHIGAPSPSISLSPAYIQNQGFNPLQMSNYNLQHNSRIIERPIAGSRMINLSGNQAYISHANLPGQSRMNIQPTFANNSYSRVAEGAIPVQTIHAANLYQNIKGFKQKKQTETRISYHPYTRTYIDYQEQIVLVPVQRTRIKYYQKIIETQYVKTPIQQVITQTVAVQKDVMRVQYIPVEQQIIHFPIQQKRYVKTVKTQLQKPIIHQQAHQNQINSSVVRDNVNTGSRLNNIIIYEKQNFQPNNSQALKQYVSNISYDKKNEEISGSYVKPGSNINVQSSSLIHQESKNSIAQQKYKNLSESQINEEYRSINY